jgi:hypothetical protein
LHFTTSHPAWRAAVATAPAVTIAPDTVVTFQIKPGTLLQFLEARAEGGPRLKCFEGSVTLVSPGMPHEMKGCRLDLLILAVCLELGTKYTGLASTTWTLPFGAGDTGYEADRAYYIQSHGTAKKHQPPDLAIEIVVSHSEKKALRAGAFLKILSRELPRLGEACPCPPETRRKWGPRMIRKRKLLGHGRGRYLATDETRIEHG